MPASHISSAPLQNRTSCLVSQTKSQDSFFEDIHVLKLSKRYAIRGPIMSHLSETATMQLPKSSLQWQLRSMPSFQFLYSVIESRCMRRHTPARTLRGHSTAASTRPRCRTSRTPCWDVIRTVNSRVLLLVFVYRVALHLFASPSAPYNARISEPSRCAT